MLDENIRFILKTLKNEGFEAYIVGGVVRNSMLNLPLTDTDITTNALPDEIERIFEKTIPTGKKYGTITVRRNKINYELTTYRSETNYSDGRRPDIVKFSNSLSEDLMRRDFTINALCMDVDENILDLVDGKKDIENKLIRAIGNAEDRFKEDALRMIRGVRIMTQLEFTIEDETEKALIQNSNLIANVSRERIREELNKLILSDKPSIGIRKLIKTGLMAHIIPEYIETVGFEQHNPYHDKDVFEHSMEVLDNVESKLELRLAAFFHDIGKPSCFSQSEDGRGHFFGHHIISAEMCRDIMQRLHYSNIMIENVTTLVRYHLLKSVDMKDKGVKRYINNVGIHRLDDMFKLNVADIKGKAFTANYEKVNSLRKKVDDILSRKEPLSRKDLAVNGRDLERLRIEKGKQYTEIFDILLDYVLEFPEKNNRNDLFEKIIEIISIEKK